MDAGRRNRALDIVMRAHALILESGRHTENFILNLNYDIYGKN